MAAKVAQTDGETVPSSVAKLADYVKPGAVFSVWTSDYEASDLYPLTIESMTPGGDMVVSFPASSGKVEVRCDASAVKAGSGIVFLSQGSAMSKADATSKNGKLSTKTHCPPFLLSRSILEQLRAGQEVTIAVYTASLTIKRVGTAQATVRIDDKPFKVPVLHAQDTSETDFSPVDLWVMEHPLWPLVLKLEFGGECEISLFEIEPAP